MIFGGPPLRVDGQTKSNPLQFHEGHQSTNQNFHNKPITMLFKTNTLKGYKLDSLDGEW